MAMQPDVALSVFEDLGSGFYRTTAKLTIIGGLANIGTHMGLVRLTNGKFVALGTVHPTAVPGLKDDIDKLTDYGKNLEAVMATHPFHSLYFKPFQTIYPDAKYYGTPRHLRILPDVKWAGVVNDATVQSMYEPELDMRILPSEVSDFENPLDSIHFNNVLVFHKESGVMYNDDMFVYIVEPRKRIGCCVSFMVGIKHDSFNLHPTSYKGGIHKTKEAFQGFETFVDKLLVDWDIKTIATAHNGVLKTDAKQRLRALIEHERPKWHHMRTKYSK